MDRIMNSAPPYVRILSRDQASVTDRVRVLILPTFYAKRLSRGTVTTALKACVDQPIARYLSLVSGCTGFHVYTELNYDPHQAGSANTQMVHQQGIHPGTRDAVYPPGSSAASMTKALPKIPPEVAAVLTGRNPFLRYSQRSQVFRDVFDFGDQSLYRKDNEELVKLSEANAAGGKGLPKHMSMVNHARKPPQTQHGSWRWDSKLGFLFVPKDQTHTDAKNETRAADHERETLKLTGKFGYKKHRHPADKIIEGFSKLIKDKEPETDVVVEEARQVELEDIKRGAVYLTKYTLHHKITENVSAYYDKLNCVRGIRVFMKQKDYDDFLLALIHYFHFYLVGLTQKYFRLTIRAGKLLRLPAQIERPCLMERERQRRVFRYEIHKARLELARRYTALVLRIMQIGQPEVGSLKYKPHSVVPERFFFESLLDLSCIGVCVAFLQRSNRFIRSEFGRLFRREAFNMNSLERTMDFTYYESYSERALRVLQDSRHRAGDKERAERDRAHLSPRSHHLRLSDDLVKPTMIDWKARVAANPPIWKTKIKIPFYIQQPSMPNKKDYPTNKHRIANEMRRNSPILDFQLAQKYYKLRDKVLHPVPGAEELSLMAQLRQNHEPVRHIQRRNLTPFHSTLGILGKHLKLFDYWTLLPMMNDERKLTLPSLTHDARYRAFKTTHLLFPRRSRRLKSTVSRQEVINAKSKEILQTRLRIVRSKNLKI